MLCTAEGCGAAPWGGSGLDERGQDAVGERRSLPAGTMPVHRAVLQQLEGRQRLHSLGGHLGSLPPAGRCCSSSGCAAASTEGAWGEPGYRPPSSASGFFKGDKNQEAKENVLRCAAGPGVACCSSSPGFCCCHRCVTGDGASSGQSQGGRGLSWAQQERLFSPGCARLGAAFRDKAGHV